MAENVVWLKSAPKLYISNRRYGRGGGEAPDCGPAWRGENGEARTREAKLGCAFTQTKVDEKGRPQRDEASTTYVGAIGASGGIWLAHLW
ncbi:MAG: hypothetical protein LC775_17910, partial [Acidobacteria bacterium]|nr:hypothetical protein [Acidobacteriota bacterium]